MPFVSSRPWSHNENEHVPKFYFDFQAIACNFLNMNKDEVALS